MMTRGLFMSDGQGPRLLTDVSTLPAPPYPDDIRATGWGFELDPQRIESSDTFLLASPVQQAWLLKLWFRAWQRTPCGTLPSQDALIAAVIGMHVEEFFAHRSVLLRGWVKHRDGLLYHRVIIEMVWHMMGKRRRDKERIALIRKESQRVATSRRESQAATATATGTATEVNQPKSRTLARATRLPDDWQLPDDWKDWAVRVHKIDPQKVIRMSLVFRDYWIAVPGAKGCKLRWDSTWRNWIRKECGE